MVIEMTSSHDTTTKKGDSFSEIFGKQQQIEGEEQNISDDDDVDNNEDNEDNEETLKRASILLNSDDDIKLDDYDIFVLRDSNELPEDLNIESAFNFKGQISNNRNSLDSLQVDNLPMDDINVYLTLK